MCQCPDCHPGTDGLGTISTATAILRNQAQRVASRMGNMRIVVIGASAAGLITSLMLARAGHDVVMASVSDVV